MKETQADQLIRSFETERIDPTTGDVRPFRPPVKFHQLDREVYALVEFPTKVMLHALQTIFEDLWGEWHWEENDNESNIFIGDQYPEIVKESENTELKPAIITSRGPIAPTNTDGRGRQRMVLENKEFVQFTEKLQTQMTIHCVSKEDVEAERLASIVFALLMVDETFAFKLRGVHAILNPSIAPVSPMEVAEQIEAANCPVNFTMEFSWSWARRPDGDRLSRIASLDIKDS